MDQKSNAAGLQLRLAPVLAPLVQRLGYEFVGLRCPREEGSLILRLYIDGPSGIALDDCERVSREVEALLDGQDLMGTSRYYLEVSSPGIERPLFSLEDFARFAGRATRIRLKEPLEGRRRLSGTIVTASDGLVTIQEDQGLFEVPYRLIDEAHLAFVETKQPKKTFKKRGVK